MTHHQHVTTLTLHELALPVIADSVQVDAGRDKENVSAVSPPDLFNTLEVPQRGGNGAVNVIFTQVRDPVVVVVQSLALEVEGGRPVP